MMSRHFSNQSRVEDFSKDRVALFFVLFDIPHINFGRTFFRSPQ